MTSERSPVTLLKLIILLLGVAILGVGLDSYFNSAWVKDFDTGDGTIPFYCVCKNSAFKETAKIMGKKCPPLAMEIYFICTTILCFFISLAAFPLGIKFDLGSYPAKFADAGVHGLCAVILLIAGILFLISAIQIDGLMTLFDLQKQRNIFKFTEKIVAGVLVLVQSILYGTVAVLIVKMKKGNRLREKLDEINE